MERAEILATMSELKLYGMKAAFDEIITTAVKRQHEPQRVVGDLLTAEITEKQARSIKYQIAIAKLPLARISTTSTSTTRRSMRPWFAILHAVTSWHSSAMSC
jgi:IstB-like ATP binding protein